MTIRFGVRLLALACFLAFPSGTVQAQPGGLPAIRLDNIFPAGGRVGTTFEVQISGADLDDAKTLHFDHPGIKAEFVAPNRFKVTIPANALAGTGDVRVSGKFGVSNPRAFLVSDGLEEVPQKTPNHTPDEAQKVSFGCAVNGRFSNALDDYYRVPLKAGRRVVVDLLAERLDAEQESLLSITAPDGREIASGRRQYGRDPMAEFTVPENGDYLIRVFDIQFRPGGSYRLHIGSQPVIDSITPGAAEPGKRQEFLIVGRNLPGGKPLETKSSDNRPREQVTLTLTPPAETDLITPVRSPGLDFRLFQHAVRNDFGPSNPVGIALHPGPFVAETEPNDDRDTAQELPADGAVVTGHIDRNLDRDWYRVRLKAKATYCLDVACERLGSPGHPFVRVYGPDGKFLQEFDGGGANLGGAYRGQQADPFGSFTPAADGDYFLLVQDRTRLGSPRHRYVLRISPPRPDFAVFACWNLTANTPTPRLLYPGTSQILDLVAVRRDNFAGEIAVEVEGLPPGLQSVPAKLGTQPTAQLLLTAAVDVSSWEGPLRIKARAKIADRVVERPVWGSVMISNATDPLKQVPSRVSRSVWLAVRPGAPFTLMLEPVATIVKGQKLTLKVTAKRTGEFRGPIRLSAANLPGGLKLTAPVEIAAPQSEATVTLEGGNPGEHTVAITGEAQVPFTRDPKQPAKDAPVQVLSTPAKLIVKEK